MPKDPLFLLPPAGGPIPPRRSPDDPELKQVMAARLAEVRELGRLGAEVEEAARRLNEAVRRVRAAGFGVRVETHPGREEGEVTARVWFDVPSGRPRRGRPKPD